jgi:hypothetical protein
MLLTGLMGFSQADIPVPAKITIEDLAQKSHPHDSTAVAAYLYRYGKTWFEVTGNQWVMVTEIYNRIKIYKKEGYEYADREMVYYSGDWKATGKFSGANTYNLTAGLIEQTALKEDGQFETRIEKDYTQKKITLPNVKVGSIIEYKYTVRTPYFSELRDFRFQFEIPCNDARYDVSIPEYFYYNVFTTGKEIIKDTESREVHNKRTDTKERYRSYTAKNVEAFTDEAYVDNLNNYIATVKHELSATAMPGQEVKKFATDWKSVAQKIYAHDKFGRELKFNSYFEEDINPLLINATTETDKANIIFNYVKSRMNWNKEESYLCETGVKKAYAGKVGNAAEINLMLTAMLRHAGLDANPVLVSTKDNGIALYPTRLAYNYVISAVKIGGKTILLDATSKYSQFDIMPIRSLNWLGRLIKKNGDTEEIDLMPKIVSKEFLAVMCTLNTDGSITGKVRDVYNDYRAYNFREKYAGTNKDNYIEKLEGDYKGITINDYTVTNENDITKALIEDYTFSHNMVTETIGNKMYLNPLLFFTPPANPFKQESRLYPIDFVYPRQDKYIITITLPAGYKVESLPKATSLAMEDGGGTFKYNTNLTGNNIQLLVTYEVSHAQFSAEFYRTIKDFFQKMIEKQNEKIVLVKS